VVRSDPDFLGLRPTDAGPGHYRFDVVERLSRLDGMLYGGSAIAASITAAEELTERAPLWMTTQFVSSVGLGTTVDLAAEVLAEGRRTAQVRITGTGPDGAVVFASLGATGVHRPDGLTGEFEHLPTVTPPDDSDPLSSPFSRLARDHGIDLDDVDIEPRGFGVAVDTRHAEILHHPDPGDGRVCLWIRRRDGVPVTPAIAAYLADLVPSSVARAAGVIGGGTSLDNTIRFGTFVPSEWILLDLRPHFAAGGYGSGVAHVWSGDGRLLATASQTASMLVFDPDAIAAFLRSRAVRE
jgi:acyl-CoA thioesterase II